MENSSDFLAQVLDAITENIVVINSHGDIKYVNKSLMNFGSTNACIIDSDWQGINYIYECDKAAAMGDDFGLHAAKGIRSVIDNKKPAFYFEYPCHSPEEKRWFMMRVSPFAQGGNDYYVIAHQNITERKLAEEKAQILASLDGLTKIANRRSFDDFLHQEWRKCLRLQQPICLAIIDIDHFKLLNDHYGHQAGDDCLVKVGRLLKGFAKRPGDMCARYGGEEFALIWSDTELEQAKKLATNFLEKLYQLNIANILSPTASYVTASIGLAQMIPAKGVKEIELLFQADSLLYQAKEAGRNRIEC